MGVSRPQLSESPFPMTLADALAALLRPKREVKRPKVTKKIEGKGPS
jgi:hypothetical protein